MGGHAGAFITVTVSDCIPCAKSGGSRFCSFADVLILASPTQKNQPYPICATCECLCLHPGDIATELEDKNLLEYVVPRPSANPVDICGLTLLSSTMNSWPSLGLEQTFQDFPVLGLRGTISQKTTFGSVFRILIFTLVVMISFMYCLE